MLVFITARPTRVSYHVQIKFVLSLFACPDEEGMVISACNRETAGHSGDSERLILTLTNWVCA